MKVEHERVFLERGAAAAKWYSSLLQMDRAQVQQLDGMFAARKMRIDQTDLTGSPAAAACHNQRANQSPGDNLTSCWAPNGAPPSGHRQAAGGSSRYSVVGGQQLSNSATLGSLSTYPDSAIHGDRLSNSALANSALYNSHPSNDHQTGKQHNY